MVVAQEVGYIREEIKSLDQESPLLTIYELTREDILRAINSKTVEFAVLLTHVCDERAKCSHIVVGNTLLAHRSDEDVRSQLYLGKETIATLSTNLSQKDLSFMLSMLDTFYMLTKDEIGSASRIDVMNKFVQMEDEKREGVFKDSIRKRFVPGADYKTFRDHLLHTYGLVMRVHQLLHDPTHILLNDKEDPLYTISSDEKLPGTSEYRMLLLREEGFLEEMLTLHLQSRSASVIHIEDIFVQCLDAYKSGEHHILIDLSLYQQEVLKHKERMLSENIEKRVRDVIKLNTHLTMEVYYCLEYMSTQGTVDIMEFLQRLFATFPMTELHKRSLSEYSKKDDFVMDTTWLAKIICFAVQDALLSDPIRKEEVRYILGGIDMLRGLTFFDADTMKQFDTYLKEVLSTVKK